MKYELSYTLINHISRILSISFLNYYLQRGGNSRFDSFPISWLQRLSFQQWKVLRWLQRLGLSSQYRNSYDLVQTVLKWKKLLKKSILKSFIIASSVDDRTLYLCRMLHYISSIFWRHIKNYADIGFVPKSLTERLPGRNSDSG